jgi:transcriptional regulatory protein RtcR
MATLAPGGRITTEIVDDEIARLHEAWRQADWPEPVASLLEELLSPERLAEIDAFDRVQLEQVLRVCRSSPTLSDAGRRLFAASRARKAAPNDADRLRKYLARFGLDRTVLRGG